MDFKEFEYVIAISEEGTISAASDRLYVSQPSISKFLKKLEDKLDITLFDRTATGVKLTFAGEIYVENAKRTLKQYRITKNKLKNIKNFHKGRIDFGISSFRGSYLIPQIMKHFYDIYPNVDIIIHEYDSKMLKSMITDGKLDLALIAKSENEKYIERHVLEDEIVIVSSLNHPIENFCNHDELDCNKRWVEIENLSDFDFILSPETTVLGKTARQLFGMHPNLTYRSSNNNCTAQMALELAKVGIGLAFSYRSCCDSQNSINIFSINEKCKYIPLVLLYPNNENIYPTTKLLANLIVEYFNNKI